MSKFLDYTGLQYYRRKEQAEIEGKTLISVVPNSGWNIGYSYNTNGGFNTNASRSIYFVNNVLPGSVFSLTALGTTRYAVGQFMETELTINSTALRQVSSGWQSATSYNVTLEDTTHSIMILLETGTVATVNAAITGITYYQDAGGPFIRKSEMGDYTPLGLVPVLRNGMIGNQSATKAVTTAVMPTFGRTMIGLNIGRPNTPGYEYRVSYALTSAASDIGKTSQSQSWSGLIIKQDWNTGKYNPIDISAFPNAVGIAFDIWEVLSSDPTTSSSANTLRTTDFDGYKIEVNYMTAPSVGGSHAYTGEPLKLNLFDINSFLTVSSMPWHQSMVFFEKYGLFFNDRTMKATLVNMEGNDNILATLDIPYGSYEAPHCNTASLGIAKNGANSIMPLVYASQWTEGAERACFVYDVTLSGSTYALSLVQKINLSGVSSSLIGSGPCDFVVDTDNSRLIAFAYKTAQTTNDGTALMICQFALPATSESEVILTDADVLAHIEATNLAVRQDAFYNGGKIFIMYGNGSGKPMKISTVRISDGEILTTIPVGGVLSGEMEGLDIYSKQIVFSNGYTFIYRVLV